MPRRTLDVVLLDAAEIGVMSVWFVLALYGGRRGEESSCIIF